MATSVQLSTLESQAHVGKTVSRCVKVPLVEFHQRLKDTACSKQFHLFCKKRDPSFSHLLLFRAFGAAFGVPISGFLPMWLICKAFNRLCRSCTGRMPKRPERVATTWRDSNCCKEKLGISTVPAPQILSSCDEKNWPGAFSIVKGFLS